MLRLQDILGNNHRDVEDFLVTVYCCFSHWMIGLIAKGLGVTQCLFHHFQVRFVHGCVRVSADNNIIIHTLWKKSESTLRVFDVVASRSVRLRNGWIHENR